MVIESIAPNQQWGKGPDVTQPYASLIQHLSKLITKGLSSVMLFGVVDEKESTGALADHAETPVIACLSILKQHFPSLLLAADVCLCEYTDHGHCGVLRQVPHETEPVIDNALTIARLAEIAVIYAQAGADLVCPSDMMDNRVSSIRQALDGHGFSHVSIMAYTSKKASCLYAPFRQAVDSTFCGDRKRYQHPVGSTSHAALAYERDVAQGADSVIVKPALFYTDIIQSFRQQRAQVPVAGYVVSGEYKMLKDYGESTDALEAIVREAHVSLLRAGCSIVITYFTPYLLEQVL